MIIHFQMIIHVQVQLFSISVKSYIETGQDEHPKEDLHAKHEPLGDEIFSEPGGMGRSKWKKHMVDLFDTAKMVIGSF